MRAGQALDNIIPLHRPRAVFVAFFFSAGSGLIVINNLGQLVPAVGGRVC